MTVHLTQIWRHPIKSLGRERISQTDLKPGEWLPNDRLWAITHDQAKLAEDDGWARCANFLRCATAPGLMAVTADLDEVSGNVRLHHPGNGSLEIQPDNPDDIPRLLEWLGPIWPQDRPKPIGIHRNPDGSLTDQSDAFLSLHNHASHRAVEDRVGRSLSILRWRGNLWFEGLAPWQEFEWIGKEIRIGTAVLHVEERIERCKATMANPETGERDVDTLAALRSWGHEDFGVFARVKDGGEIAEGDVATVPA